MAETILMTRVEAVAAASSLVDEAGIAAATGEDIRHHMIQDGEGPDAPPGGFQPVPDVQSIRERLSMSQATVRNREQRRTGVAPSAHTLAADEGREFAAMLKAPA